MPVRDIKTRFTLEGEQKFKQAMSEAAASIKVLNSEEKLATAEFKASGDAQKFAADKARILKEQIEQQKKAVAAAENAIKALTANGVDQNSKQMQAWQTKLNNAKTGLVNLQAQLDRVGTETQEETKHFKSAETGAAELKAAIEKVGQGVDFQNVISSIDTITGHMESVVKQAAKTAKAIWNMGLDAGRWADDVATASREAGVDVETYQSWMYASQFIDTSVSDIIRNWKDIDNKLAAGGETAQEYAEAMESVGISVRDTNGTIKAGKYIFWDAIDYLHGISDEGERTAEAIRLFGNDWRRLNPLIDAGSAAYRQMAEEGRQVAVVSEENVNALGEMDDSINDFNSRYQKFNYDALAALAPVFKDVADAMSVAISALDDFVTSEEGQQMFSELNEALSGLIKSFLGEDNGKKAFATLVDNARKSITKLTNALDWIIKNGNTVKDIVIGLGVAWTGLKVTKEVLTFMQLLKATPLSKLSAMFGGGGAGAAASAAGAAGTGATGTGAATAAGAAGLPGKFAAGAGKFLGGVAVPAAVVAAAVAPAMIADELNRKQITERLNGVKTEAIAAAAAIGEEGNAALQAVNSAADALGVSGANGMLGDPAAVAQALENVMALDEANPFLSAQTRLLLAQNHEGGLSGAQQSELLDRAMMEALKSLTDPQVVTAAHDVRDSVSDAMDSILEVQEALDEGHTAEKEGSMYSLIRDMSNDQDVIDNLSESTRNLLAAWLDTESGFGSGGPNMFSDSQQLLDAMLKDLGDAWDSMKEAGGNVPAGLAEGIEANSGEATGAAETMAGDVITAAENALGVESPSKVFHGIGENVAVGMANGIYARGKDAINAAMWLAKSVENIVRGALQIHSPSGVFEDLGEYTGLGFAAGIERSASAVSRAVGAMVGATSVRPAMSYAGAAVSVGGGGLSGLASGAEVGADGTVHVTLVLDEEVLGDVMAPIVNDRIGTKINATRR